MEAITTVTSGNLPLSSSPQSSFKSIVYSLQLRHGGITLPLTIFPETRIFSRTTRILIDKSYRICVA